jgi:hypothetical protein
MHTDDQVWKYVWYILNPILLRPGGKGCAPKGTSAVSLNTKTYPDAVSMCAGHLNEPTQVAGQEAHAAHARLGKSKRKRLKGQVTSKPAKKALCLEFLKR